MVKFLICLYKKNPFKTLIFGFSFKTVVITSDIDLDKQFESFCFETILYLKYLILNLNFNRDIEFL